MQISETKFMPRYNSLIQNFYKILVFEISILQSKTLKHIFEGECTNFRTIIFAVLIVSLDLIFRCIFVLSSAHFYVILPCMPKVPSKPAAKKTPAKTATKAKIPSKAKEEKVSVIKEKEAAAKVLKADELLG